MNEQNYIVLSKVISAVETGDQVYGQGRYNDYTPPYKNTPNEHTITLGWAQNYGYEARKLIQMIFNKDKAAFRKVDTCSPSIESMLSKDWEAIKWNPNSGQKNVLIKLISSDIGRTCQDELFAELMKEFVSDCEATYTKDVKAVMMYCQIRHLGGKEPVDRIFKRCNGNYSMDNIMSALKQDQYDTRSSNQVGDSKFWSRHQKCYEFINKYAVSENGTGKEVKPVASALSRAKTLLRMNQNETMTGYTPDGKQYFVDAGAWYKKPKKGDVIYFYSSSKGRVGHVGIVEWVNESSKTVGTVEGNTSSTEYAENGGCVARHSYSYASQGGTNRVNGFGRPNFTAAGVTADQFVATAVSFLGYMEKRSNSQLDSKTANAGSNNYQRFQRDVGAGNGDQWCQYFVSAIGLYTCQGTSGGSSAPTPETTLNETSKWTGYVTADSLNVRTWAGTDNPTCSFSPLSYATAVGVCDSLKAENGDKWYYILYNNKHGFVSARYIDKTKPSAKPTVKKASDITLDQFLESCKNVMDTARKKGYKYGDSHAVNPTTDGIISCDRMVAKALYNLGFKDQRVGGEVVSSLDAWLKAHGFTRSTSSSAIKKGSILLVKHEGHNSITHAFVVTAFNKNNWVTSRYDAGSQERINSVQPIRNVTWGYRKDSIIVYNIPSSSSSSKSEASSGEKGTTWKATATSTYNGLKLRKDPAATTTVLCKLNKGDRFEIDGKTDGIYTHAKVGDQIGWVKTQYVKKD